MRLNEYEKERNNMMATAEVYVTSTCPFCTMMTNYLKENNIPYKTINIETDQQAAKRLVETTGQLGVPQTKINGKWIIGFDPNRVQQALKG
nr:glutaredoxin domain-containing protein [Virgibacillus proomii]